MAPMDNLPTDARQLRSRRQLLDAMLHLLETRPYDQVTIREVAREAEVGYATFFRHYPSKDALLHDLAAGQIADLLQRALPILFADDARQSCMTLFAYVAERRALWSAFLTGGAATMLKQEFTDQARQLAQQRPHDAGWLPDELRIVFAVSATVEILAWWLQQEPDYPLDRMAEILDRLVVTPSMQP
ncbi:MULTISPECIES: TetR/AcrR family transcriptional regulator [Sphingobium]|jgi:AcrR family transcriptional regulator|uniref:TetR family transcriptional regulator n=2 Tax=Pseudomonadota TaxID=1224 RepID=A0A085JZB7_SPHYA|nr:MULTISPECIES: TetR/AcrR family transcriptional regulator [Sphingobium]RSU70070.1 TetR/AcrR family transcriptional regulator [Sphingomonas sp. S-NIH.Pt3_0716]ATI82116.1 TetR/AcrR family transcriptional regulator [Sphingobium yanoikuyae]ATP17804.1 TetR family transcriptional regulator [Sphingobium yanoikuyae]AYO79453.1 TetR/AcrR family transcriptional regulator [Sphingobium yanoikuyae]KFD25813.1 TetR family transcriptional regulator [Sphingobium yanoikuyae]